LGKFTAAHYAPEKEVRASLAIENSNFAADGVKLRTRYQQDLR
jgi:hypothetical protein